MRTIITPGITGAALRSSLNANFLELYRGYARNAEDYGFSSAATAAVNTAALQSAVLGGNCSVIVRFGTGTGIFEMNDTIILDDNTAIVFEEGIVLKKAASYCQVFMNRGAMTKTYNENILIDGLTIDTNSFDPDSVLVWGLRAHMGFYYVKNLVIKNFSCPNNLGTNAYMFSITRWENIRFENIFIGTQKDGINLGTGHDAIIENYTCESYDDASALFTCGYPAALLEVGDIYNVKYINCKDRTPLGQVEAGFFCRAMLSSWADWTSGFTYQTGDLCLNAGHLYQNHNANSFSGVGTVAPVHHSGAVTGADGVIWRYKQDCSVYHADIWDISFHGHEQTKNRPLFYANSYIDPVWCRTVYPGTEHLATLSKIRITNSNISYSVNTCPVYSDGGLSDIVIANNSMAHILKIYGNGNNLTNWVSTVLISLTGNSFNYLYRICDDSHNYEVVTINSAGNSIDNSNPSTMALSNFAALRMIGTDLPLAINERAKLFPTVGDTVRDIDGTWIYKLAGWFNISL